MRSRHAAIMCAAVVCVALGTCQESGDSEATTTAEGLLIAGARIFDPTSGLVSEPQDVRIAGDTIVRVEEPGATAESAADTVDARGAYLMPGLIDVHAHIGDGGIDTGEYANTQADREGAMAQFARYGVTTIFAPGGGGGNNEQLAEWKVRCAAGELTCPRVFGSGDIITAPGSHPIGTLWAFPEDADPAAVHARGATALPEAEPAEPLIDRMAAAGVDAIKIAIEDGPGPWRPRPRLSTGKVREIVEAAHARDLRVFAHVGLAEHVADGVAAGIDGVMHSADDRIPEETLETMADRGVFYVATLALFDGLGDRALGTVAEEPYAEKGVSPRAIEGLRASIGAPERTIEEIDVRWAILRDNLHRAVAAGVPVALGTDTNNPTVFPGYAAHEELALMVEAGLTPAQALAAATTGSAAFLRQEDRLGRIAPGYRADLIVLLANPLEDILNTRTLEFLVLGGEVVRNVVSIDP